MKVFSLSFAFTFTLLAISTLVPVQAQAQEPQAQEPESCAAFRVRLDCSYTGNVAIECRNEDMEMMGNVVHAIVELDYIMAQLGSDAPQFDLMYESFGDGVTVDHTGDLAQLPSAAEIQQHLTPQDEIQAMIYDVSIPATEATDGGSVRRLQQGAVDLNVNVNVDSPGKSNWQPVGTYSQEGSGRDLQTINCGTLKKCTQSWCCAFCGVNCRRRRLTSTDIHQGQSSLRGLQQSEYEEKKAEYVKRVEMMESRVSKLLTEKMRYLASSEAMPCLGNFWEMQVEFKTTLAETYILG
jgi:hypothetical protein